jgi:hypothetical protein
MPTYAGLRLLLGAAKNDPDAMLAFINQRTRIREAWRYFGFQSFKDAPAGRKPEYRNCIIGSPVTTLAEAHVLALMAKEKSFAQRDCAYSYLWPSSLSEGRNYAYYFDGYQKRTQDVNDLLDAYSDNVAVVTDIKKFYPSVSKPRLKDLLARRIAGVSTTDTAKTIHLFVDGLLNQTGAKVDGLPIGPDMSHLLGHVALDEVDREMEAEYGKRYLRYVDDIVVVCPRTAVRAAIDKLKLLLGRENLTLNDEKQDIVDKYSWRGEGLPSFSHQGAESFAELISDISAYLIYDPDRAESLHETLKAEGFSLPIGRLTGQVRSKRYRWVFAKALLAGKWLFSWTGSSLHTTETLLAKAKAARGELLKMAESLDRQPPSSPMRRRWFAQHRKSVYNRLLYLLPKAEYRMLLDCIPELDEFHDVRTVASAIVDGDATRILACPGRVASTFCQLWPEHHGVTQPTVNWPSETGRAEGETAANLALRLSIFPPDSILNQFSKLSPGARILIDLCSRSKTDRKLISEMTYLDEMEHLFREKPHSDVRSMLQFRFDEDEESGLEALALGGGDYFTSWQFPDYVN